MMKTVTVPLYEFNDEMEVGVWYDALDGTPARCFMHCVRDSLHYILYLCRYPHVECWEGRIIQGADDERTMCEGRWSDELFRLHRLRIAWKDLAKAKETIMQLFKVQEEMTQQEIEEQIAAYEKMFGVSSDDFLQSIRDGTAPDTFETNAWQILLKYRGK